MIINLSQRSMITSKPIWRPESPGSQTLKAEANPKNPQLQNLPMAAMPRKTMNIMISTDMPTQAMEKKCRSTTSSDYTNLYGRTLKGGA